MNTENETTFEDKIMQKFPNLFHKDSEGNPIPADCGISCPPGWEHLVENLCFAIDNYVKHAEICTQKHKTMFAVKMFFYGKLISPIGNIIFKILDPYQQYKSQEDKKYKTYIILPEISKMVKEKHSRRLAISKKVMIFFSWFRPYYKWNTKKVPPVRIGQIKEKFGTLRFYYDGGNSVVSGMKQFAEHLSSVTCEQTGLPGSMYKKNGWWQTLSPKMAKKFKYNQSKN